MESKIHKKGFTFVILFTAFTYKLTRELKGENKVIIQSNTGFKSIDFESDEFFNNTIGIQYPIETDENELWSISHMIKKAITSQIKDNMPATLYSKLILDRQRYKFKNYLKKDCFSLM